MSLYSRFVAKAWNPSLSNRTAANWASVSRACRSWAGECSKTLYFCIPLWLSRSHSEFPPNPSQGRGSGVLSASPALEISRASLSITFRWPCENPIIYYTFATSGRPAWWINRPVWAPKGSPTLVKSRLVPPCPTKGTQMVLKSVENSSKGAQIGLKGDQSGPKVVPTVASRASKSTKNNNNNDV